MSSTTTLVARQCHLRRWAEEIKSCQGRPRDMTVAQWCSQNGLTKANYYYHLRQVRKACLEQLPEVTQAQEIVAVPGALLRGTQPPAPIRRDGAADGVDISCGRFRVHVTEAASTALLEMVLKVAAHVE